MPGSVYSASGSQHSSGSRRARTRQYHVVAHKSQVDESLFGTPHRETLRQEMLEDKWTNDRESPIETEARKRSAKRGSPGRRKKETVQVITKDLIRNLIVPDEDPSGQSLVLAYNDFLRIKDASRVLSPAEKIAQLEKMKRDKEEAMDACQDRKNFMKQMDLHRRKNEKLNEFEEEAKLRAQYLVESANDQRQEQEDEIKYLNELILNAKCHAIRDAQILEKRQIKYEMHDEEQRLDQMMEVDRVNAIGTQDAIEKTRKDERLIGAMKLMEQIQENEQEHLLELERKDQENIQMQKYLEKLCEEEAVQLDRKRESAEQLRVDLNQANKEILQRKVVAKEQERVTDLRVLEFQKQKAERDAAYEQEQEAKRIEKEREVARLRTLQERARDEQAERDFLRAKRAQEQAERDWRRKEAGEQAKKSDQESMLKNARGVQMQQKEHFLAVQAQRDRAEFERVLRAQKELVEKEKRETDQRQHRQRHHADDVRAQIRDKEQQRISDRNSFFEEGMKLDQDARERRSKLDNIKQKKIDVLRAAGIHEKYLAQVERKINQPQNISA